jgi:hypothetical protein
MMVGEAEMMGRSITVSQKYILPGNYMMEASMSGMTVKKEMLKDGKHTLMAQGMEQQPDEEDKEELNEKASFFSDAYLLNEKGNTYTVGGIEKVEGSDAYAVQVKTAAGREYTNYYDVASGLKVKTTRTGDGPAGPMTIQAYFQDYKDYNGVKIPTHVVVDMGQFKQDMKFKEIKVNSGLKAEDFK